MVDKRALLEAVLGSREKIERLKTDLDAAKDDKIEAERKLIELMDLTGEKSVKLETHYGLQLVVRRETLYVSVNKDDQEKLLLWVDEECGRPDMIKQSVHNKTLQSFIDQRIKDGDPVPPFVKMFFKPGLTIRRGNKE